MDLNVSTREQEGHVVVTTAGEIDLHTASRLQEELAELQRAGAVSVIVDLSGVEFCDSTGVNVLLGALRRSQDRGGRLCLVNPRAAVRKVLSITGLDSVFTVCDSVEHVLRPPPPAAEA